MHWQEVCEDSTLQNLPYKIELNKEGHIVMSPAKNRHSVLQGQIQRLLNQLTDEPSKAFPECAINTEDGVKVADVVWISSTRYQQVKDQIAYDIAPEICIEVLSASNTPHEMRRKTNLYLQAGAEEVWICDEQGHLQFYHQSGEIQHSLLLAQFPQQIVVD